MQLSSLYLQIHKTQPKGTISAVATLQTAVEEVRTMYSQGYLLLRECFTVAHVAQCVWSSVEVVNERPQQHWQLELKVNI